MATDQRLYCDYFKTLGFFGIMLYTAWSWLTPVCKAIWNSKGLPYVFPPCSAPYLSLQALLPQSISLIPLQLHWPFFSLPRRQLLTLTYARNVLTAPFPVSLISYSSFRISLRSHRVNNLTLFLHHHVCLWDAAM